MKEQLISLETAELAILKGFNWVRGLGKLDMMGNEILCSQSLLQKWLRDVHKIYITVERCVIGSDEWEFGYFIEWLPKENHDEKRRVGFFKEKRSFVDNYPYHYLGAWHSYEEALEQGLVEGLKLISSQEISG